MHFRRRDPEVLITGAGPVGLMTALILARRGVSVEIIDAASGPVGESRALALHPATLRLFQELGLATPDATHVQSIGFYDGRERRVELAFADLPGEVPSIAVVGQDRLQRTLIAALQDENVQVGWNRRLKTFRENDAEVSLVVENLTKIRGAASTRRVRGSRSMNVQYLLGADGHNSTVRRRLGIAYDEVGPSKQFAVFEFSTDFDPKQELRVILGAETNVLWPQPEGRCRFSFQLDEGVIPLEPDSGSPGVRQFSGPFPILEAASLERLIRERAPWFGGSIDQIHWSSVVRFEQRLAASFGSGRVWLVGDAAHANHPVGAQSMNIGLREACDLAEAVAKVVQDGASVEEIERYGETRREEWRFLLGRRGCMLPGTDSDPWLSRHLQRILSCIPASGLDLVALARELEFQIVGEPEELKVSRETDLDRD